ncbi:histidine phosphatase family protein [Gorillibacterium massiliense]|uniref:histidine phosphatase family protein n=1 Tax=Gorillibacterium massiliense TaxID=1280390 RepID=UPI0009DDF6D1
MLKNYKNRNVILVTHGHVIRSILMDLVEDRDVIEQTDFQNTSINIIEYRNEAWRIKVLNNIDHLK